MAINQKIFGFLNKIVSIPASKCNELGSSLILPRSEQEDKDLFAALQSLGQLNEFIALDGNDIANEGMWVDSTGSKLNYFNWSAREPNNLEGRENHLHYWNQGTSRDGQWNDISGDNISSVVCSKTVVNGKFCKHDFR